MPVTQPLPHLSRSTSLPGTSGLPLAVSAASWPKGACHMSGGAGSSGSTPPRSPPGWTAPASLRPHSSWDHGGAAVPLSLAGPLDEETVQPSGKAGELVTRRRNASQLASRLEAQPFELAPWDRGVPSGLADQAHPRGYLKEEARAAPVQRGTACSYKPT